jgi:ADP-ribosylglycohydrolase
MPVQEVRERILSPEARARSETVLGCLLGGALGDAYGYCIQLSHWSRIHARRDADGLMEPTLDAGVLTVSDDTQMTLFTAEGLARAYGAGRCSAEAAVASIRKAYLDWLATQTQPYDRRASGLAGHEILWARRAPGNTCLLALGAGAQGTPEQPINDSKGCGGVMRAAPVGLMSFLCADAVFDLAHRAAALTHGHPNGRLSAGALAVLVHGLAAGAGRPAALAAMRAHLIGAAGGAETLAAVDGALALARSRPDAGPEMIRSRLGLGWTGDEALAIALFAAQAARDFKDALRIAVSHDGDCDSTASIAGQIWGADHGLAGMPQDWIDRLDVLEPLCEAAQGLLAAHGG